MLSAAGALTLHRALRHAQKALSRPVNVPEWDAAWQQLLDVVDSLCDDGGGHFARSAGAMGSRAAATRAKAPRTTTTLSA